SPPPAASADFLQADATCSRSQARRMILCGDLTNDVPYKSRIQFHRLSSGLPVLEFWRSLISTSCSKGDQMGHGLSSHMPELAPSSTVIIYLLRWRGSRLVVYLSVAIIVGFLFAAAALIGIPFTRDVG